jgi:hypothetical protein
MRTTLMPALALVGIALAHGATITREFNYAQTFGAEGLSSMSIYAPRFDSRLGTLERFTLSGIVSVQADLTVQLAYTSGDLDFTTVMGVKLKWDGIPNYDLDSIQADPIHIANVGPEALYQFPNAINGSARVYANCGFSYLFCGILPQDRDYRFSLRFESYRDSSLPSTYSLAGAVNADFTATYEYTPAAPMIHNPEPASWALITGGLGGLAYYRRRR